MHGTKPNFHKLVHYHNPDIQLELAKPNKSVVGHLTEAFNIKLNLKLGQIADLTFSIPYSIEKNFIQVKNKHVDKIKQRYLIKASYLGIQTWFVVAEETDDLKDKNIKHVTTYSLGYLLSDKYIRQWAGVFIDGEYTKISLNAKQVMDSILSETNWTYDVQKSDALFLTRYRSFEFANTTRLEAVMNIAETFNAIIEWDTHNRKIIFHDAEKYGSFRGLFISDEKYLNSYERVTKSDEMATRLSLIGKDGLTINEVNPSGTDYIEDLSYFLKGFNMDSSGNVISRSQHVSDGLCKAIIKYQQLIISKDGQFTSLRTQKETLQKQLKDRENELFNLKNELVKIQAEIDIAESRQQDASIYKAQEVNKKLEIANKESQITTTKTNISTVDANMTNLKNLISMENNFTPTQLEELNDFIIERSWENENISDPKELMELGKKEMEKLRNPNVIYNIGLVHLLRIAEAQRDVKKLRLGDKIRIHKKEMDEIAEAQILEMKIDFSGRGLDLTIANFSTNKNDEDALASLIYKNSVATTTVNMNKSIWNDISNVNNRVETMLTEVRDAAKHEIESGALQSVVIDNRGITTFDMTNQNKFIRIMGGILGMTNDGGQTFKTAITAEKIVAELVMGRLIVGQGLYMENEKGAFKFDQYGVTIKNTALTLTADSGGNGITLNAIDGLMVTKSDGKVRSIFNSTEGIKIQVKKGTTWNNEFYYDIINERLVVDGAIHARELKVNGQNVLTSNGKIDATHIDNLIVGETVKMGANASISWSQVSNRPTIPTKASDVGAISNTYIDSSGIWTGSLNANNIIAGKVSAQYIDVENLTVQRLESKKNGRIVTQVYQDSYGGYVELLTNSGQKAINMSVYSGNGGQLEVYNEGTAVVTVNNNGLRIYRKENQLFMGGIAKYSDGSMYMEISDTDGSRIFNVSKYDISYKGNELATKSWVTSMSFLKAVPDYYATKNYVDTAIANVLASYSPPSN